MLGPDELVPLHAAQLPEQLFEGEDDVHDAGVERLDDAERLLRHLTDVILDAARLVPPDIGLTKRYKG